MARAAKKTAAVPLERYRAMRDFGATPEPSGGAPSKGGNSFVIQKHAATRLHYDFRLELDGVLLSWAIPKGPSTKAGERRLAARTEDHPLDYGGFEGIIPKGQYGGGSVIVWDRGTWQPDGDPREGLKKGKLTFNLVGEKLSGRWHLVRTHLGAAGKETWLLFKGNDDGANDSDIEEEQPNSVVSGKSVDEIGAAPKKVWLPKNIRLTHPEKVLYPNDGVTKETLAIYYLAVKDQLLPLIANRPLSLYRCPSGVGASCFFQKHAKDLPQEIHRVRVEEKGEEEAEHTYVDSIEGVLALVQMSVLEIHTWGCHADKVDKPDQLVFDLDPDEGLRWNKVVAGANQLREFLEELGLRSFLKTTGGKGLHVVVPVERRIDWDEFKAFSKNVVLAVEAAHPESYTTNPLKKTRTGKIFLDYLRNGRGATAVAPYSTRAREGATVSTPIDWQELTDALDPKSFTVLTVPQRLAELGKKAPWHDYNQVKQSITAAMRKQVRAMKPMLAKPRPELPIGDWLYEPKWDGFRCLIFRDGDDLQLQSRNEKPLNRYFPELVASMLEALPRRCVVDGEIVISGPKGLDFDALLQRVHPAASRVAKLSKETPASFVAFDLIGLDGADLAATPFGERRALLEKKLKAKGALLLSPSTRDVNQARAWFTGFEGLGFEGVVAKDPKLPYLPNQRAMIKVKHQRTADCVIGGYREAKDGTGVASLLLGLYDDAGVLHHVGVAAGLDAGERAAWLRELEPLRKHVANHPWRVGDAALQRIPGGKSRWNSAKTEEELEFVALQPKRVVEVAYDHLQGDRFRHTTHVVRDRPDRDAASCTYAQLA